MRRYHQLISQLDVVQKISQDADERRRADPKANKEQHVVVPEILCWGAVGAIDQQPWRTASEPRVGKAFLSFILIRKTWEQTWRGGCRQNLFCSTAPRSPKAALLGTHGVK